MSVKRFAPGDGFDHDEMVSDTEGSFVMFADYKTLLTKHAEQAAEIAKLRQAMDAAGNNLDLLISYEHSMSPTKRMDYTVSARNIINTALAASEVK